VLPAQALVEIIDIDAKDSVGGKNVYQSADLLGERRGEPPEEMIITVQKEGLLPVIGEAHKAEAHLLERPAIEDVGDLGETARVVPVPDHDEDPPRLGESKELAAALRTY
jgi:hypothetical protein